LGLGLSTIRLYQKLLFIFFEQNGELDKTIQKIPEIINCLTEKGLDDCQSLYNSFDNSSKTTHEP